MNDVASQVDARTGGGVQVAIDGPSGTGKSSVSKEVARRLGFGYLDTGAMYRALTWWCLDQGIALTDQDAVAAAAAQLPLEQGTSPDAPTVSVAGRNIDREIRESALSEVVSQVATNRAVRPLLQQRQRDLMREIAARTGGVIAEGRDVTTVVAPDAPVRILMTASPEVRMARRSRELAVDAAATRAQIVDRDRADATVSQFLTAADGVTTLDTSDIDFEQSVQAVLGVIAAARG